MIALPHPEVIITHESDLDGLVSGVLLQRLARKVFNAEVPLEAYHYNHWIKRDPREKSAWVADLTFRSAPRQTKLADRGSSRHGREGARRPRSSTTSPSRPGRCVTNCAVRTA
jgi:hypothetical protein